MIRFVIHNEALLYVLRVDKDDKLELPHVTKTGRAGGLVGYPRSLTDAYVGFRFNPW